jgi:hypothetical protein
MCHLPRHMLVAGSLDRNPVRERTICIVVTPYIDKQIVGGDQRGLLPFLNTWHQSRVSVEPSEILTVYLLQHCDRLNCVMALNALYVSVL